MRRRGGKTVKKLNKWIAVLLLLTCHVMLSLTCKAAPKPEDIDLMRLGTAEIQLKDLSGNIVKNREVNLTKVADVKVEGEEVVYKPAGEFADSGLDLSSIESTGTITAVFRYSIDHAIAPTKAVTGSDGKAIYHGLETGLYLIYVSAVTDGVTFSPFLMALPQSDDARWNYYVIATPKALAISKEVSKELTVKKLWNDNGHNRPSSVVIELLKNGSPAGEITLSDGNHWSYKWEGLSVADAWTVREKEVPKGYVVSYSEEGGCVYVSNTGTLIQTGQLKWPIFVLAGLGIVFVCVGVYLRRMELKKE